MRTNSKEHRDAKLEQSRKNSVVTREVGPLRKVADWRRRKKCERDLKLFIETYLPAHVPLEWSVDHEGVIKDLERVVLDGGQYAVAMPRGTGKSTLVRAGVIWAIAYGHRKFPLLLGATDDLATQDLTKVKTEIETNDLLDADFPDLCQCPRALERVALRAKGQLLDGVSTRIEWGGDRLVFAHVKKGKAWAPCAGSVLAVAGLTGSFRGLSALAPDGSILRPDLVIADDPQTHSSAISPSQSDDRERILNADVLGLAGPDKKIAAIVPCTIIAKNDLSDRILDRQRNPQWNGRTTRLVNAWPTNEKLWAEYDVIRRTSLREGRHGVDATEFYRKHRKAMDVGADVPWSARFSPDELSAIQHAYNLRMDRPGSFDAEFQNAPVDPLAGPELAALDAGLIIERLTHVARGVIPRESTRLTCGIDVGGDLHWYSVIAWDETYGGSVIDYGTWPPQGRDYFRAAEPKPGLSEVYPELSEEGRVYQGLVDLLKHVHGIEYVLDEAGGAIPISRTLVDSGYLPDEVFKGIRESGFKETTFASKGKGIRPDETAMMHWPRRDGERRGKDWMIRRAGPGRTQLVTIDTNTWKSFLAARLLVPFASPGRLGFYGKAPHAHRLFGDHCTAEFRTRAQGRDRVVDLWALKPNRSDNHLFDTAVLNCVAASIDGLAWEKGALGGATVTAEAPKPTITLSAIQGSAIAKEVKADFPNQLPGRGSRQPITLSELQQQQDGGFNHPSRRR